MHFFRMRLFFLTFTTIDIFCLVYFNIIFFVEIEQTKHKISIVSKVIKNIRMSHPN